MAEKIPFPAGIFMVDGKVVSEEEAYAAIENAALELHPNVPHNITFGMTMLNDKILDVAEALASNPAYKAQADELLDCSLMARSILSEVSDAFDDIADAE